MNDGQAALAQRRRCLVSRIAAQRAQVEAEFGGGAVARKFGEVLRRNAVPALILAAGAGFLLTRSGLYAKALRAVRLANLTARWWMLARLGWQFVRRSRSGGPGLGDATR